MDGSYAVQLNRTILIFLLALTACTPSTRSLTPPPPDRGPLTPVPPSSAAPETAAPANNQPCTYVFADQNLPDISIQVEKALKGIQTEASGSAYASGENCIDSGGHATFGAMETDFRVKLKVSDYTESALGNWIIKVMKVLAAFPPGVVPGPERGRVEFEFDLAGAQNRLITVPIAQYESLPPGTSPQAVYRAFSQNP